MMMTLMDVAMVTFLTLSSIPRSGSSRPASFPGASLAHEGEILVKTLDWKRRSEVNRGQMSGLLFNLEVIPAA